MGRSDCWAAMAIGVATTTAIAKRPHPALLMPGTVTQTGRPAGRSRERSMMLGLRDLEHLARLDLVGIAQLIAVRVEAASRPAGANPVAQSIRSRLSVRRC